MSVRRKPVIAVIGGSVCTDDVYSLAREVGREIALAGCALVCGGLSGVMEGAAEGASLAQGEVIGILPGLDKDSANKYVSLVIPTGLSEARNALVVNSADVVIALEGEFGTMSEIALALRAGKPVISLGDWKLSDKIIAVGSASEAVKKAKTFLTATVNDE